jgi:hypothetical protein
MAGWFEGASLFERVRELLRVRGESMKSCHCSILDVREEQIYEPSGSLEVRLICNICGKILESRLIAQAAGSVPGVPGECGELGGSGRLPGTSTVSMQL